VKYALFVFPLIGLVRGLFDPGIFRKKIWKWTIFGLGITMILLSLFIIEDTPIVVPTANVNSAAIDMNNLETAAKISVPFTLSTDNFFGFFGFILMIIGFFLNGKNITLKNERYGEIVKKIRV
jgi:hypothetical protein